MPITLDSIRKIEQKIAEYISMLKRYEYVFKNNDNATDADLEQILALFDKIRKVQDGLASKKAETVSDNPKVLEKHQSSGRVLDITEQTNEVIQLFKTGKDPYDGSTDKDGVSHNDVDQGSLGDCYFMAAVGAVAKANPQAIKNLISGPDKKGNYQVKLYVNKNKTEYFSWRNYEMVTITPEFLVNSSGKPIYAGLGDGELWVMLLEKAYAILRGKHRYGKAADDYQGIAGGSGEEAIEVLTGQEAHQFILKTLTKESMVEKIRSALDENKPITTTTPSKYSNHQKEDMRKKEISLYASHVYYILDIDEREILLRNPHNNSSDTGRSFRMNIDHYRKYFVALSRT
jgi:hypothetical protein